MAFTTMLGEIIIKAMARLREAENARPDGAVSMKEALYDAPEILKQKAERPAERALSDQINELSEGDLLKVWLLMICGKEKSDSFKAIAEDYRSKWPARPAAIAHIVEKQPLGEYLKRGRATAVSEGIDLDTWM